MVNIIYPCNHCVCCCLDLNNPKPYVCTYTGYHSWSPEALSYCCENDEMVNWANMINEKNILEWKRLNGL